MPQFHLHDETTTATHRDMVLSCQRDHFQLKNATICQDRLGTSSNMRGKLLCGKSRCVFCFLLLLTEQPLNFDFVIHLGQQPKAKRSFFGSFPCLCPEPVLVKCSFLDINGSKRRVFTHRSEAEPLTLVARKRSLVFECFPYVCPEPVLVKRS